MLIFIKEKKLRLSKYILLLFFIQANTFAQEHLFYDNKIIENLPSLECYNIHQDNRGYIWFSTEAGLCRFNGKSLNIYTEKKGFPEKVCYGICEDNNGKLWFVSSHNKIYYYNYTKDSLCEANFNAQLQKLLEGHYTDQIYVIKIQHDGQIALCSQSLTFIIDPLTNRVEKLKGNDSIYYFQENKAAFFPIKNFKKEPKFNYLKNDSITLGIINTDTTYYKLNYSKKQIPQWRCLTTLNKQGDLFIGWDHTLIKISNSGLLTTFSFEGPILSLYLDKNEEIWVGTLKNGVFHFKSEFLKKPIHSLNQISVTGVLEDNEKGIWCSTLEHGIYYCKNKSVLSYANMYGMNKVEQLFKPIANKLYCYPNNSTLLTINSKGVKSFSLGRQEGFGVLDIIKYKKGFLITNLENITITDSLFHRKIPVQELGTNYSLYASKISISPDNRFFLLQKATLLELDTSTNKIQRKIPDLQTSSICLLARKHEVLLGCKDGLYTVNLNSFNLLKIKNGTGVVTRIIETEKSTVLVCFKDKGIYRLLNDTLTPVFTNTFLGGAQFFDLCLDNEENLWVATNLGLMKTTLRSPKDFVLFHSDNGLPGNQIYKVACVDGDIYFVTPEGLYSFPYKENLSNSSPPKIYLRKILVNQVIQANLHPIELSHDYSNLTIEVNALTFKNFQGSKIFYRLSYNEGHTLTSDTTSSDLIQLNNLAPNEYKLSVYAINNSNIISKEPVTIYFIVKKPFWQRPWFYVSTLTCLSLIAYLIIRFLTNKIKQREKEKTKINKLIAEYQLNALQAQMNPHFVFNAINSIQGYILNKDEQHAYDYLAKFSKLIRMVLNSSLEKTVVLKNELEMLELYIELEQLRFNNNFSFELQIDKSVSLYEFQIPTMLIQPYIENAIWHGLMNLPENRKGVLKVTIDYLDDALLVTIKDNGIGRDAAKRYSKNSHISVGMKLTEQRVLMLNQIQDYEKAEVKIIDLSDKGIPCGTMVKIIIPLTL